MDSLKELYIDQLQDLWSANRQACRFTEKLADVASDEELKRTLQKTIRNVERHNQHLEELIRSYDADPSDEHCKGMEGLIKEATKHALEEDYGSDAVRDCQIIAQYQRMIHYGMAVYGTCCAFARELGCDDDEATLSEDLEDVFQGDKVMTRIAEESVNHRAAA